MLKFLKRLLDFRKLDVEGPKLCRVVTREVSAQQITAFAAPHLTQFIAVKFKAEGVRRHRLKALWQCQLDQARGSPGVLFGRPPLSSVAGRV
jgi:hypothetical protein